LIPTPRRPVTKTVGSVTFEDPYDWLHEDTDEALAWQWLQDAEAEREATTWPHFEALHDQIRACDEGIPGFSRSAPVLRGARWFWGAPAPETGRRQLWTARALHEPGQPLFAMADHVAPEEADHALATYFQPSPDGRKVAVIIDAKGGSFGAWHFIDCETGKALRAPIPCHGGFGLPGWLPDSSGLYLQNRDEQGRLRIDFVSLAQAREDRDGVTFTPAEVPDTVSGLTLEVSPNGRWIVAVAGPHERVAYMIGDTKSGLWRRFLPEGYEGELSGGWIDGDTYVARAHGRDHPRGRIVAIPAETSRDSDTWREIERQTEATLRAVGVIGDRVVVADLLHAAARFRTLDKDGGNGRILPLEGPGSSFVTTQGRRFSESDALTFDYSTFAQSETFYHYDFEADQLSIVGAPGLHLDGIKVRQEFARSPDGALIPYFLVHREDLGLDQPRPALINAYGGFNVAFPAGFLGHFAPFVQAGGVMVFANLRGGGEYGKAWHDAGRLACKWNTFLDLFSVAEKVIGDGITSSDRLAMTGASNGGLLAGAAIVHRPDLFRVVVPEIPLFDQLRMHREGPEQAMLHAIALEDYGDAQDPVMSKIRYSYSPYHNVREGVRYPAVFQVFGELDRGCPPFHGRKFTAALRAASSSDRRILLRVWKGVGHGIMPAETSASQRAEWLGFIMAELGMSPAA